LAVNLDSIAIYSSIDLYSVLGGENMTDQLLIYLILAIVLLAFVLMALPTLMHRKRKYKRFVKFDHCKIIDQ